MVGRLAVLMAETSTEQAEGGAVSLTEWISNLPFNAIYVAIVIVVATVLERVVNSLLKRVIKDSAVSRSTFVPTIVSFIIWGLAASCIIPAIFDIDVSGLLAALGVGSVCASVGLQDTIKNVVAGFSILYHKVYKVGDNVEIGSYRGEVIDITWRETMLKDFLGDIVIIPNGMVNSSVFYRREGNVRFAYTLVATIRPGLDLDMVKEDLLAESRQALIDIDAICEGVDPKIYFMSSGPYGIESNLVLFLNDQSKKQPAYTAVMCALSRKGYLADGNTQPVSTPKIIGA